MKALRLTAPGEEEGMARQGGGKPLALWGHHQTRKLEPCDRDNLDPGGLRVLGFQAPDHLEAPESWVHQPQPLKWSTGFRLENLLPAMPADSTTQATHLGIPLCIKAPSPPLAFLSSPPHACLPLLLPGFSCGQHTVVGNNPGKTHSRRGL